MHYTGDIRRHGRVTVGCSIQVSWKDRFGNEKYANAEVSDVSEAGMRIKVPEALTQQTLVTLRSDKLALHGQAAVRSCRRQGNKYSVGLEFIGGLSWKPRAEAPRGH